MTITPMTLDTLPAVKYNEVTAAYMSNEATMFPIDIETTSKLWLLKS